MSVTAAMNILAKALAGILAVSCVATPAAAVEFYLNAGQFPDSTSSYVLLGTVGFSNDIPTSVNQQSYVEDRSGDYIENPPPSAFPNVSEYAPISWVFDFSVSVSRAYDFNFTRVVGDINSSASVTGGGLNLSLPQASITPPSDQDWSLVYFQSTDVNLNAGIIYQLIVNGYNAEYLPPGDTGFPSYYGFWETTVIAPISNSHGSGPIPEPATWAVLNLGLAAVGAALRFRRKDALVDS